MNERYLRNYPAITEDDQEVLRKKTVAVIGCGGLGGHIIDAIARIGVGHLTLVDADVFSVSNLNRQLLATEQNIGKSKAQEAAKRVFAVNSSVDVRIVEALMDESNVFDILDGADLVIDALDNVKARRILAAACRRNNLYLVHGAVGRWNLQVSVMKPGSDLFDKLYPADAELPPPSVLSFVPPVCAGIQACEAVKLLLGLESDLDGKLLLMDLKNNQTTIVEI